MRCSKTQLLEMFIKAILVMLDQIIDTLEEMLSVIRTPDGD